MTPEYRDFLEIQTLKEEIQKLDIDARSADALRLIEIKEERLLELCRRATTLQPRFVKEGKGHFNENNEWVVIEKGEELHPIEVPAGPILLKGKRWEHLLAKLEQEAQPPKLPSQELPTTGNQYSFTKIGKRGSEYDLTWNGYKFRLRNDGADYIYSLMRYYEFPKQVDVIKLASDLGKHFDENPSKDEGQCLIGKEGLKDIKAKMESLREEIFEADANNDYERKNAKVKELEEYEQRLKSDLFKGKNKMFGSPEKKVLDKVRKAISHALDEVRKESPDAHNHLKSAFSPLTSNPKSYKPAQKIPWKFN